MIVLGTYLGIAVTALAAVLFAACVRWQLRLGGFRLYAFGAFLCMAYTALITFAESATLSPASLQRTFDAWHPSARTLDEFRPLMIARNNSMMISTYVFTVILTALLALGALNKSFRLRREQYNLLKHDT
jgi:hypothetical protein